MDAMEGGRGRRQSERIERDWGKGRGGRMKKREIDN